MYMSRKEKALEFANEHYNISIVGRHIVITSGIKDYVIEKISKLERFMSRVIDVHVIIEVQKLDHRIEIVLKTGRVKFSANASSHDLYLSIDESVRKLEAQILKYKGKLQDFHKKEMVSSELNIDVLKTFSEEDEPYEFEAVETDVKNLYAPHRIVKSKSISLKTLTPEEALMKMDLSGDAFLVFKNEIDAKLKVLYRRKDETYGIMELPV
jgi:putative sigma-54 modulation protein